MSEYLVPFEDVESEFVEKRSRFICHLWHVECVAEARARIEEMKMKYYDARHNCWCYLLKEGNVVRYSDDGEPQGTAGQPMLNVFQREGVENVCCVVTRYFGGILLGAGGLVRAYAHAAKLAVDAAQRKVMSPAVLVEMQMDYNQYGRINNVLSKYTAIVQDTAFTDMVTMRILFIERDVEAFRAELTEMTAATVEAVEVERLMGEFPL